MAGSAFFLIEITKGLHRYKVHRVYLPDGTVVRFDANKEAEMAHVQVQHPATRGHTSSASGQIAAQNQMGDNGQTGQSSVRNSIDEANRAYMAAVESGDTQTAQRMMAAAEKAG